MSGWVLFSALFLVPTAEPLGCQGRLRKFEEPFQRNSRPSRPTITTPTSPSSGGRSSRDRDEQSTDDTHHDDWNSSDSPSRSHGRSRGRSGSIGDAGPFIILGYPFFDHHLRFQEYPFERNAGEGAFFSSPGDSTKSVSLDLRPYGLRIDEDLFGVGGSGTFRWGSGSSVHVDVLELREDVDGGTERLGVHKYLLTVGPGEGPRDYHWSAGAGVGVLDGEETQAGFALAATGEWYVLNPISVRGGAAIVFYEEAALWDFEAEIRVHLGRFALGGGIRSLVNSDGDDLTGPTLSLAVWF